MSKIAVLIYGRLNKCAEHYENTVETIGKENHIDFFASSDNSPQELLDHFKRIYNPVAYINDPITYTCDFSKYKKWPEVNINNMTRHFINKNRVFSLLEESHKQYDIVISLRIDLIFSSKFNFSSIEENTVYIPEGCDYHPNCVNDQIAYGRTDVMKLYHSIYPNAIELLQKGLSCAHPESLNYANLKYNKVRIHRFPMKYTIER
jgi:hypothetical protein